MIQQRQYLHHLGIHRHISCKCLLRSINILVILDNNLVKDDLATFTTASKMINYNTFTVNYITRTVHPPISSRPSAADFHGSRCVQIIFGFVLRPCRLFWNIQHHWSFLYCQKRANLVWHYMEIVTKPKFHFSGTAGKSLHIEVAWRINASAN